jgi:hypothetical protein
LLVLGLPALAGGNANFVLGIRGLDEDSWEPAENQGVFGVTVDFGPEGWPINLEACALGSGDEQEVTVFLTDVEVTGRVGELGFGVNKLWNRDGTLRPYVGGGLAAVNAVAEVDSVVREEDDEDDSFGLYVHGGVFWRLGPRFNLGLDGRLLGATDITLFDEERDADYAQLGLVLGWGWPAAK